MSNYIISDPANFLKALYVSAFITNDLYMKKRSNIRLSENLPGVIGIEYEYLESYIQIFDELIRNYQESGKYCSDTMHVYIISIETLRNYDKSIMSNHSSYSNIKKLAKASLYDMHSHGIFLNKDHYKTLKGCIRKDHIDQVINYLVPRCVRLFEFKNVLNILIYSLEKDTENAKIKYREVTDAGIRLHDVEDFQSEIEQIGLLANVDYVKNLYDRLLDTCRSLQDLLKENYDKPKYRGIGFMDKELLEKLQPIYYVYTFTLGKETES